MRDRCARGEIPFTLDPSTGHRRIDAKDLEALGYDLSALSHRRSRRERAGFHASLTTELEGTLDDDAVVAIAEQVATVLADRDVVLAATAERLGEARFALRELAAARFWQRRRVLAKLRATPSLSDLVLRTADVRTATPHPAGHADSPTQST